MILNNEQNATNLLSGGMFNVSEEAGKPPADARKLEKSKKRNAPYGVRLLHSSYNPHTYTAHIYICKLPEG